MILTSKKRNETRFATAVDGARGHERSNGGVLVLWFFSVLLYGAFRFRALLDAYSGTAGSALRQHGGSP